jgi:hypothetical protein
VLKIRYIKDLPLYFWAAKGTVLHHNPTNPSHE